MSNKKETENKRVPLITRTCVDSYTYNLYSMENGAITSIGQTEVPEKLKQSDLNKIAKEQGVKKVIAEITETKERLLGITVEQFLELAKPVKDGKLFNTEN